MAPSRVGRWTARITGALRGDVALGMLAVVTILAIVLAVQAVQVGAAQTPASAAGSMPTVADSTPAVLFIGDEYTIPGAGITNTFAQITAQSMGWVFLMDAQSGTGFVAAGQQQSSAYGPYFSRLDRDKAAFQPDYVVVTGGRNDGMQPSGQVVKAATSYLRSVRQAFPYARLVVVAPFWVDSHPPRTLLALRDAERSVAPSLHAVFIDPLGKNWISNANESRYIAGNQVDPTVDGHAYLAKRLTEQLQHVQWPDSPSAPAGG